MNTYLKNALTLTAVAIASQVMAQVTFYEQDNFRGRSFTTENQVGNFQRYGFNDSASSVVVTKDSWEVCETTQFGGRCAVLQPGRYPSLAAMGLNDRVSSVRAVRNNAPPALSSRTRRSGTSIATSSMTAPPRWLWWVGPGSCVKTISSGGVASSCVRDSTHP